MAAGGQLTYLSAAYQTPALIRVIAKKKIKMFERMEVPKSSLARLPLILDPYARRGIAIQSIVKEVPLIP